VNCIPTEQDGWSGTGLRARLGLGISETITHTGAPYVDQHQFKIDVAPCERHQFRTEKAGTSGQNHHRPLAKLQLGQQSCELSGRKDIGLAQTLGRCAYIGNGIPVHPFVTHCVVEQCGHNLADLASM
jgi:hypothetical protein